MSSYKSKYISLNKLNILKNIILFKESHISLSALGFVYGNAKKYNCCSMSTVPKTTQFWKWCKSLLIQCYFYQYCELNMKSTMTNYSLMFFISLSASKYFLYSSDVAFLDSIEVHLGCMYF